MVAADLEAMDVLPPIARGLPILEAARRVRDAALRGEDPWREIPVPAVPTSPPPLSERDVEGMAVGGAMVHDLPLDAVRERIRSAVARGERRMDLP
jgi:hypothetical protein